MEYKRFNNTIVVRINRGEEILSQLKQITIKENIKLAKVNGLGATDNFTVGAYSLDEKQYHKNTFKGTYEIVSLHGNITTMNDETYLHLHMSCADEKGNVVGGHLNECFISATCELFIDAIDGTIDRQLDEEIGINLFKF